MQKILTVIGIVGVILIIATTGSAIGFKKDLVQEERREKSILSSEELAWLVIQSKVSDMRASQKVEYSHRNNSQVCPGCEYQNNGIIKATKSGSGTQKVGQDVR